MEVEGNNRNEEEEKEEDNNIEEEERKQQIEEGKEDGLKKKLRRRRRGKQKIMHSVKRARLPFLIYVTHFFKITEYFLFLQLLIKGS